ncbi:glycosyltransferase [uncultured Clostridium sp.]|uniref:glycosyltransferase family 2 protein n=1 Tax=uncultured Clostridium sp. TaxID=59620 RepID=UPI0025F85EA3|nr:glycosyltransferase [uncultured Clostridium sp.]
MDRPMITVLMAVYNGEKFLKEAMESILNQTYKDFEFLIINDGSTDKSVEIIESFNDPRIRLVHNEKNLKLIASLNKGISLARGKYIARMDCDDISMPERFEKEVEFLENHSDYGMVGTCYNIIDAQGKVQRNVSYPSNPDLIKLFLSLTCPLVHGSVMIRAELLKKNLYGSNDFSAVEDYELWTRIAEKSKIYNIPEHLFRYRIYGESFSDSKSQLMHEQTVELSKVLYKKNKREYKRIVKEQIFDNKCSSETDEAKEFINKWLIGLAKRFLYVCDVPTAAKLYLKAKNNPV